MNDVKLVTYDLNREVIRPKIVDAIKKLGSGWARLSESSYAIADGGTVEQVYGKLKPLLDNNDYLYVVTLKKPWTGFGLKKVNEWVESNLTH
jgi:hypothetical protein